MISSSAVLTGHSSRFPPSRWMPNTYLPSNSRPSKSHWNLIRAFAGKIKWYVQPLVFGGDAEAAENTIG